MRFEWSKWHGSEICIGHTRYADTIMMPRRLESDRKRSGCIGPVKFVDCFDFATWRQSRSVEDRVEVFLQEAH